MKKYTIIYLFGIIALLFAMINSISSLAYSGFTALDVYYDNIKIKINNEIIDMKDSNKSSIEPFIIDGTTYVPVRAVSEALGKKVEWDSQNKIIHISDFMKYNKLTEKSYKTCSSPTNMEICSENSQISFLWQQVNADYNSEKYVIYEIDGERLTGTILPPQSDVPCEISYTIKTGDLDYKTFNLLNDSEPINIDIPISNKDIVIIQMKCNTTIDKAVTGSISNLLVWY